MSTKAKEYLESELGKLTLGKLIWSIRTSEEMTLDDFSSKLKISKSHLCDIEKGRKFLSPERAQSFAKKLKYSPRQFVRLAIQDRLDNVGLKYHVSLTVE